MTYEIRDLRIVISSEEADFYFTIPSVLNYKSFSITNLTSRLIYEKSCKHSQT
jgi:hypothetical protein